MVFDFFRRKKLTEDGRRRLLVSLARAEEALVDTHVRNALDLIEVIGDELPLDRVLELYLEAMELGEGRAEVVARRVLSRLEAEE